MPGIVLHCQSCRNHTAPSGITSPSFATSPDSSDESLLDQLMRLCHHGLTAVPARRGEVNFKSQNRRFRERERAFRAERGRRLRRFVSLEKKITSIEISEKPVMTFITLTSKVDPIQTVLGFILHLVKLFVWPRRTPSQNTVYANKTPSTRTHSRSENLLPFFVTPGYKTQQMGASLP